MQALRIPGQGTHLQQRITLLQKTAAILPSACPRAREARCLQEETEQMNRPSGPSIYPLLYAKVHLNSAWAGPEGTGEQQKQVCHTSHHPPWLY